MRVRLIYISSKRNSKVEWPIITVSRIKIFSNLLFVLSNNGELETKCTINLIALETDVLKIIFLLISNSTKEISSNRLKSVSMVSYIFINIFYYHFCVLFHQILERPFVLITACFNRTLPAYGAYCVSFENGRTKGQVVRVENKKHAVKVKLCRDQ